MRAINVSDERMVKVLGIYDELVAVKNQASKMDLTPKGQHAMTNHPRRSRGPYTAEIFGPSINGEIIETFETIRECRAYSEIFGNIADKCTIRNAKGEIVAIHMRDKSGDGMRWYRAGWL